MTEARIALTTAGSRDEAETIARSVVESGLATCVNLISGARSIYRWEGKIEEADEVLLVMKTSEGAARQLEAEVRRLHSYTTPEFVEIPITGGSREYLDWLMGGLRRA